MDTVIPRRHDHHEHLHVMSAHGARRERRLLIAFGLTAAMLSAEVVGGLWSGSLALLADAGHMLVDALALLLALVGARLAARPADARRSYGYGRMEVLAGFVNALLQLLLTGWIVYEAVARLRHPHAILSGVMLVVACAGLLVNVGVLRILRDHAHDDVNMAGAALHVAGDLLGSLAAIAAALAVWRFDWLWADPVLSVLVALLILVSAWRLLRRSTHILLEGVPDGMDGAQVAEALCAADASITGIHHLHVWQLASGLRMATLHATLREGADSAASMGAIHSLLHEKFGIQHVTVQVDAKGCPDGDDDCSQSRLH